MNFVNPLISNVILLQIYFVWMNYIFEFEIMHCLDFGVLPKIKLTTSANFIDEIMLFLSKFLKRACTVWVTIGR